MGRFESRAFNILDKLIETSLYFPAFYQQHCKNFSFLARKFIINEA